MELDKLEKLLEKYLEAETTVEEEAALRAYFEKGDVPPQFEEYRPMFGYFSNARVERYEKPVPLNPVNKLDLRWVSVAAVAVFAFGILSGKQYQDRKQAEYAYLETRKALESIGKNLEKGTDKVAYLNQFEVAKRKIIKND